MATRTLWSGAARHRALCRGGAFGAKGPVVAAPAVGTHHPTHLDGARPMELAMARNDSPAAKPREISYRSARDSRRSKLPGGRGRRSALSTKNVRMDP